jgi:sialic acid synthase SpsE
MTPRAQVTIGGRPVGAGAPCFVIAEAGANHDRKLSQARELIDVAADAGADAVKFQTYSAETLYSSKTPPFSYLAAMGVTKSVYEVIRENELPREWQGELAAHARKRSILFFSSPFDRAAVDELDALDVCAFKWASFEIVDLPLLAYAAGKGRPLILSTGMSSLGDVHDAVETVYAAGNPDLVLLHCVSLYPTRADQANLRMMDTLRDAFGVPVGFSDHTPGITVPVAAAARGASVIEKHFTLSRRLIGPDHPFAVEPGELRDMVQGIRDAEASLGSPRKRMLPEEAEMARLGRRSVIARVDIPEGTRITADMLIVKRPGYGIPPKLLDVVIGRVARRDIAADDIVTWEMI